jgi:hypothetical protein
MHDYYMAWDKIQNKFCEFFTIIILWMFDAEQKH